MEGVDLKKHLEQDVLLARWVEGVFSAPIPVGVHVGLGLRGKKWHTPAPLVLEKSPKVP